MTFDEWFNSLGPYTFGLQSLRIHPDPTALYREQLKAAWDAAGERERYQPSSLPES